MKKTLTTVILWSACLYGLSAQDATSLQVAPSDQVIYPDASQILNRTEAVTKPVEKTKSNAATASTKPLVASPPRKAAAAPLPPSATTVTSVASGWYLRWTFSGDESAVRAWAATSIAGPVQVLATAEGWEVLSGPLAPERFKTALAGQSGLASLVRR